MNQLQEQVLSTSEKMVKNINYTLEIISALITIGLLYFFVSYIKIPITALTVSIIVIGSFAYYLLKRIYTVNKNKKQMYEIYELLSKKHPEVTLYIPVFGKTHQGFVARDAGLYILHDRVYMEAYDFRKKKTDVRESITIQAGKDLQIESYLVDKKSNTITFKGKLMEKDYEFIVPNIEEIMGFMANYIDKKEV